MKKMPKQTSETKTKKRTQIKELPESEKTLTAKELKKVKGGVGGPCDRPRLTAVGPRNKPFIAGVNPCSKPRN
ncbi:MAG: bacteriocin [Pyrinomonadaceae bacterium]